MPDYLPQKDDTKMPIVTPIKTYLYKMKGEKRANLPKVKWVSLLISSIGSVLGIGLIALLTTYCNIPLLLPSFGASAILLYATCHEPVAQPRNVIGGHLVAAIVGVLVYYFLGNAWWTTTLGVTLAMLIMLVTRTLHPPGGATAFIAVYTNQNFSFIVFPVCIGAILLVIIAILINNLSCERSYPVYWF